MASSVWPIAATMMVSNPLLSSVRTRAKALLASLVMRLPQFRRPAPCDAGARIVLYHETPAATAQRFRQHLAYFSQTYEVVSLGQMAEALRQGQSVGQWLVITFDDGFKDNAEVAMPLLSEFGLTACFMVTTDFVSLSADDLTAQERFCRERLRRRDKLPNMTWADLRRLCSLGFEIGSHSCSHPDLNGIGTEAAWREILHSRERVEAQLGQPPMHFAWPFGRGQYFNPKLREMVQQAGYRTCSSGIRGLNRDASSLYHLYRDHLEPSWSMELMRFFLEGGYDWLRKLVGKCRPHNMQPLCERSNLG